MSGRRPGRLTRNQASRLAEAEEQRLEQIRHVELLREREEVNKELLRTPLAPLLTSPTTPTDLPNNSDDLFYLDIARGQF